MHNSNPEIKDTKTTERSQNYSEVNEFGVTREHMNIIFLVTEFASSDIGIELMEANYIKPEDIYSIFADESILEDFIFQLGHQTESYMLEGAIPFFRLLAIKKPELYRESMQDADFNDELRKMLRAVN
jgi:hypothetical protein